VQPQDHREVAGIKEQAVRPLAQYGWHLNSPCPSAPAIHRSRQECRRGLDSAGRRSTTRASSEIFGRSGHNRPHDCRH
jgi:hypothetical protein